MLTKELRAKTGLSQSKFAKLFDIPVRTLQQWEQGISSPPEYVPKMIERLLSYYGKINKTIPEFNIEDYRLREMKAWKVCIDRPFENCERIYPIQQRKVRELIDDISSKKYVKKIIIFGSSVTSACHIGSDIDIFAEMSQRKNPITQIHDFEYDFWSNYTVDDRLMKEITSKGVIVYA